MIATTHSANEIGVARHNAMRQVAANIPSTSNASCETFRSNYVGATRKPRPSFDHYSSAYCAAILKRRIFNR